MIIDDRRSQPPTNGRPWPDSRVRITASGVEGTVSDYEYWWNGHTFPVRLDRPRGTTRLFLPGDVEVLSSGRADLLTLPLATDATPTTVPSEAVGARAEGVA